MIVVRSLNLLRLKVYIIIFESIPLFLCLVFLRGPSNVPILELVTYRPVPSAPVEHWFERRLFVPDQEFCVVDVLCSSLTKCVRFPALQIQTQSTSGDYLNDPVGLGFNFRETPKSRFCFCFVILFFTKTILYILLNLFFLCLLRWCWDRDFSACFQVVDTVGPDYMLLQRFPHMNFSELYFYVCTLLDCLL